MMQSLHQQRTSTSTPWNSAAEEGAAEEGAAEEGAAEEGATEEGATEEAAMDARAAAAGVTAGLAPASPERMELMDSDEIMGEQEVRRFVLALQESGEDYIPLQKLLFGPQTRNELSHLHHSLIEMVLAKMEDENILMYRNQVIEFI